MSHDADTASARVSSSNGSAPRAPAHPPTTRFPRLGLSVLAGAIFLSMTVEFLPGGLLPQISRSFDRPLGEVGQLVSVFAAAVILSTTPLAALTRRVPRKALALTGLAAIALASTMAACAPTFEVLMGARIAGGVGHGLFWTVAAAYAADLVAPGQLSRAVAVTAAGGSMAGLLGIPIGNLLGQTLGWRAAFGTMAVLGLLMAALVVWRLPSVAHHVVPSRRERDVESPAERSSVPAILTVCVVIVLIVIGQTTWGTYSVAWLTQEGGVPSPFVPVYLLATGGCSLLGVMLVGTMGDRFPRAVVVMSGAGVILANVAFPFAALGGTATVVAAGAVLALCFGALPTMMQARMMRVASPPERGLAAALQTTAFNVGIGGGAAVGGVVVGTLSLAALPWAAAALTAVGIGAFLLVGVRTDAPPITTGRGRPRPVI